MNLGAGASRKSQLPFALLCTSIGAFSEKELSAVLLEILRWKLQLVLICGAVGHPACREAPSM